jgi:hypothetical protein
MSDLQPVRGIWAILLSMSISAFLFNAEPALPAEAMQSGGLVIMFVFTWGLMEFVASDVIVGAAQTASEKFSEVARGA